MSRKVNSTILATLLATVTLTLGATPARADDAAVMYIQALHSDLRDAPKMDGAKLEALKRGDELKVLEKKDAWVHVQHGQLSGWVSRLFLSDHRPVGQADLAKDVSEQSVEKSARKRSSGYAASASTRGLVGSDRVREGQEQYHADYQALREVEDTHLKGEDLDKFRKSAKLPAD